MLQNAVTEGEIQGLFLGSFQHVLKGAMQQQKRGIPCSRSCSVLAVSPVWSGCISGLPKWRWMDSVPHHVPYRNSTRTYRQIFLCP